MESSSTTSFASLNNHNGSSLCSCACDAWLVCEEIQLASALSALRRSFKQIFARAFLGAKPTHQAFVAMLFESWATTVPQAKLPARLDSSCCTRSIVKAAAIKLPADVRKSSQPLQAYKDAAATASSDLLDDRAKQDIAASQTLSEARRVVEEALVPRAKAFAVDMNAELDDVKRALACRLEEQRTVHKCSSCVVSQTFNESKNIHEFRPENLHDLGGVNVSEQARNQMVQHALNTRAHDILRRRFEVHAGSRGGDFATAAWRMLHRMAHLYGPDGRGFNWQMGTPRAAFAALRRDFGANVGEAFASPLNAQPENSFCSAFLDTDAPFGSLGSFFEYDFASAGGCFECGPPYEEGLMSLMSDRLLMLLDRADASGTPLTFVMVLPHWPLSEGIARLLDASKYRTAHAILPKRSHCYVSGDRHTARHSQVKAKSAVPDSADEPLAQGECDTLLLWLQSSRGKETHRVDASHVNEQVHAWTTN